MNSTRLYTLLNIEVSLFVAPHDIENVALLTAKGEKEKKRTLPTCSLPLLEKWTQTFALLFRESFGKMPGKVLRAKSKWLSRQLPA